MEASVLDMVRKQLKTPWRKHPVLEYVAIHGRGVARDGTTLVGPGPLGILVPYFETTFFDDEIRSNLLVTGFQALGGVVRVSTTFDGVTRNYMVIGSTWLDKPVLLERGTKVRAEVTKNTRGKSLRLVIRGYEMARYMVASALTEAYAS